mmetsp:Transcript_20258/g.36425  ORF Transcript_20258/g.36425 Transcript_20258/m.36425 type:complete len:270 (-) Transcript_20258:1192-2001(-)
MICRSASTISANTSCLVFLPSLIWEDSFALSNSMSLRSFTILFSKLKLSSARAVLAAPLVAINSFTCCNSTRNRPIAAISALTSLSCCSICCSNRRFFWNITACSDFMRAKASTRFSLSLWSVTNSVWHCSHRVCSSLDSTPFRSISCCRFLMVASKGPVSSSSMFSTIRSNLRLRMSISRVFFSISSLRRLISSSYFSTVFVFSSSSSSNNASVSVRRVLCASVLRMSTCTLANSFSVSTKLTSSALTRRRRSWTSSMVFALAFSVVV